MNKAKEASQGLKSLKILPFFLSAVFFVSKIFAFFAPLPLLVLFMEGGRRWTFLAVLTNSLLVAWLGGSLTVAVFVVVVGVMVMVLPPQLQRKPLNMERSVGLTLLAITVAAGIAITGYQAVTQVNLFREYEVMVGQFIDQYVANSGRPVTDFGGQNSPEAAKRAVVAGSPSFWLMMVLFSIVANMLLLFRLNLGGLKRKMHISPKRFREWKAPELLVWPTLVAGATIVFSTGTVLDVGLNCFRLLMAVYMIQGLSILSFFLHHWKVRGLLRTMVFVLMVTVLWPMTLAFGFFDLWFDFRGKFLNPPSEESVKK